MPPPSPQLAYRLTVCGELSLGLFLTVVPEKAKEAGIETLGLARPVETGRADGAVSVLLAHVVSTRSHGDVVSDADMAYPTDWRVAVAAESKGSVEAANDCEGEVKVEVGHQEGGQTVALHSLAVLPRLHRCGLGQMLMKAYLDQMKTSGLVRRVALLCQDVGFLSVRVVRVRGR